MNHSLHHRLRRAVRHWRSSMADARRAFPPETLEAITEAIREGEQTHRGEVRLIVERALPSDAIWACIGNRQRALTLFADHGIWDTEENSGVLIYVNLAEHMVDIVADRGIAHKIDNADWQAICDTMTDHFAQGRFHDGTLSAIAQVNLLLQTHFPAEGDRPNQLPDEPILL
ncbi:TPM domain-containing protein [Massilia horti]|uniref:TPM domain-containing protein n=1 Tax=Massilia horti TaxID=2562153 RepID=A0A4Y9SYK7_9BURK|nr:TPM domain-containing protein [Massilia horti]TFW31829.1 TPM domain-containing protein [Massilia horti]